MKNLLVAFLVLPLFAAFVRADDKPVEKDTPKPQTVKFELVTEAQLEELRLSFLTGMLRKPALNANKPYRLD